MAYHLLLVGIGNTMGLRKYTQALAGSSSACHHSSFQHTAAKEMGMLSQQADHHQLIPQGDHRHLYQSFWGM